jgi:hypothetical protein
MTTRSGLRRPRRALARDSSRSRGRFGTHSPPVAPAQRGLQRCLPAAARRGVDRSGRLERNPGFRDFAAERAIIADAALTKTGLGLSGCSTVRVLEPAAWPSLASGGQLPDEHVAESELLAALRCAARSPSS